MNRLARAIGTRRQFISLEEILGPLRGEWTVRIVYRGGFRYGLCYDSCGKKVTKLWREG